MSKEKAIDLSIIVPVYNEEDNVISLYNEVVQVLLTLDGSFEIIFVDDGSTDATKTRLESLLKQSNDYLRVLYHKKNCGQSAALLTGARAARYRFLVSMDGDGQNDPADIPRLIQQIHNEHTVVLGNREKRDDNVLRRLSSRVGNGVRRFVLDDGCSDTGCSLKLFPREAFLRLPHFNHMHRFLPALFKREGLTLINIKVNHRPRQSGVSKYGVMNRLFVGIYDLIGMRWLIKRQCVAEVYQNER